jgi:hypothetical protein
MHDLLHLAHRLYAESGERVPADPSRHERTPREQLSLLHAERRRSDGVAILSSARLDGTLLLEHHLRPDDGVLNEPFRGSQPPSTSPS